MTPVVGEIREIGLFRTLLNSLFKSAAVSTSPGFHVLTLARLTSFHLIYATISHMATHSTPEYQSAWRKKNLGKVQGYDRKRISLPERREYMRKWRAENPRRQKDYQLKLKFGISLEQYEQMHEAQHGLCAICRKPSGQLALAVDHDHATDVVRGLLCSLCNVALERLEMIPFWPELAMEYLKTHLTIVP